MTPKNLPIGIFDSGLGGLHVAKELIKILPHEDFLYFADSAHLPYGEKSKEYLLQRSRAIVSFFEEKKVKLIIVACHTASTNTLETIEKEFKTPILGIIEPTIEALTSLLHVEDYPYKRIAILATEATINSGVYQCLIQTHLPFCEIFPLPCPKFVPLIEEGKIEGGLMEEILDETLHHLQHKSLDCALLACTHYPMIQNLIEKTLGPSIKLIDPAPLFVLKILHFLSLQKLLNPQKDTGKFHFFSSETIAQLENRVS